MNKPFCLLMLSGALVLAGCDTTAPPAPVVSTLSSLGGSVEGWTGGAATLKEEQVPAGSTTPVVLASGTLGADGAVSLALADAQTVAPLLKATAGTQDLLAELTCDPQLSWSSALKTAAAGDVSVVQNGSVVGSMNSSEILEFSFSRIRMNVYTLVYADAASQLKGTTTCTSNTNGSSVTLTSDLSLLQGWNVVKFEIDASDASSTMLMVNDTAAAMSSNWVVVSN